MLFSYSVKSKNEMAFRILKKTKLVFLKITKL